MEITTFDSIKRQNGTSLYNLFDPNLEYNTNVSIAVYEVKEEEFMRPDLLMKSLYDTDDTKNLDIILYINNIDNPLSILPKMMLYYPINVDDFYKFRYDLPVNAPTENNVKKQLVVPNKSTRKDNARKDYLENGYSLPPTVLDKPKDPVRIEGNNILIGGL